ncbi:oxygen-insensitivone NAD(P)H nitroreductase [Nonlabens tegetincola]|uniref:Oxygen-insensitivone NAD(P)H nitroreductase n=2 Tax=Nonlabens tegetincola TaxID=323273 RepID=A0A090Q2V3_9FLAO|nr:NAD(P)H-dependent oxidoreductase [Nonlabens tegetincola]GAK96502.1 oxygen-insensitivone NAD(P)H nitroreductase [Nonlabens tegetincola]
MEIIDNLKWRYAVKQFDSTKKVDNDKLMTLVEAFNLTATSYGLQPVKLMVVKDQALKSMMVEKSYGQKQLEQASHILVFCTRKIGRDEIVTYFNTVKDVRGTADDILNPFKEFLLDSFSKKTEDEIELWAQKQAYIALGNLLTVCAQLKIDACPMEGFLPKEIDQLLGLESLGLKSVLMLPIGYRSSEDYMASLKKVRLPLKEMVMFK